MVEPRPAVATVGFVDDYCNYYQALFSDVRNFEAFKFLHIGMISELPVNPCQQLPVVLDCLMPNLYTIFCKTPHGRLKAYERGD
jgi:hypothetical protein